MNAERCCPICGAMGKAFLFRQTFEGSPLGDGYDVVACAKCGAIFSDNIPTQEQLDEYYQSESKYENPVSSGFASELDIKRFEQIADQTEEFLDENSEILDIGCSTGGLLSVFKRRGYARLKGLDPSPACAALAARNYGVDVAVGNFASLGQWSEKFQMITLVGVLEHIHDVHALMGLILQRMAATGAVLIAVPDAEEFAAVANAPFQQFSIEHVNFFTQSSLNSLTAIFGLRPVSIRRYAVQWSRDVQEPVLSIVYQFGRSSTAVDPFAGVRAIKKYIEFNLREDVLIQKRLASFITSGRALIVWGTGALARRLLAKPNLRNLKIAGFVDSDPSQQGKYLLGKVIMAPGELTADDPILICSFARESEINTMIQQLALKNEVIRLSGVR